MLLLKQMGVLLVNWFGRMRSASLLFVRGSFENGRRVFQKQPCIERKTRQVILSCKRDVKDEYAQDKRGLFICQFPWFFQNKVSQLKSQKIRSLKVIDCILLFSFLYVQAILRQGIQKQSASMDVTIDVLLLTFRNVGKLDNSLILLTASALLTQKKKK